MKSCIFWDITQCSQPKVNRRFGGTYGLHLQGRISQAKNSVKAGGKQSITRIRCHSFTHDHILIFVTVVPKYVNTVTFSNSLLATRYNFAPHSGDKPEIY
jgi:hypothetical protein